MKLERARNQRLLGVLPLVPSRFVLRAVLCATLILCAPLLSGCGGGGANETSGTSFEVPSSITDVSYEMVSPTSSNGANIDATYATDGYVLASASNSSRLKFQVTLGQMSYNYDLPSDGSVSVFPLQMGSGTYVLRVMQNTSDNNYVEICRLEANVDLGDEFAPFVRPNYYCNYTESSACVTKARELAANCENEGDVVRAVYTFLTENISYDNDKAAELKDASGYVPNPDSTLAEGKGICFDYASLAAAMLRSLGIPCKIITGYVSPGDIYHAWNLVYIDGTWHSTSIEIDQDTWSLIDTTFGAADASNSYVGDGTSYTERYTY